MLDTILLFVVIGLVVAGFWVINRKMVTVEAPQVLSADARRRVFVDTSTIMDGRILSVAETGFLGDSFLIPKSVLHEMQLLADGPDSEKRARARSGLDVASNLQKIAGLDIAIYDDSELKGNVDNRLLELAGTQKAVILTNDFNLGKVAKAQNIIVLNINDLTQSVRGEMLPGEKTTITLIQKGSGDGQAVGYLQDGTMVVVNNAQNKINQTVAIMVDRYLQTSAGKMLFATLTTDQAETTNKREQREQNNSSRNNRRKMTNKLEEGVVDVGHN
ncbi:MAG: hypothetical protein LBM97_00415 [Candidatus Nomurabacteria bacterium]|jgi:uncharacterized protein YacL|nr:hypothetical protein [Candidatus Nomurabacteria bacterium]